MKSLTDYYVNQWHYKKLCPLSLALLLIVSFSVVLRILLYKSTFLKMLGGCIQNLQFYFIFWVFLSFNLSGICSLELNFISVWFRNWTLQVLFNGHINSQKYYNVHYFIKPEKCCLDQHYKNIRNNWKLLFVHERMWLWHWWLWIMNGCSTTFMSSTFEAKS